MPSHRDCHCKHCSTDSGKRPSTQLPQTPPQTARQTTRVLKITPGDIFPVVKIPSRIISLAKHIMPVPALACFEQSKSFHPVRTKTSQRYERGWNYVEERYGRLVLVRNKKDALFDIHRGGWKRNKPRERVVREVVVVRPEPEAAARERRDDGRLFIDVHNPPRPDRRRRYSDSSSDDSSPGTPRPRIQVRRPVSAPAAVTRGVFEHMDVRPNRVYLDETGGRLLKKVPIKKPRRVYRDILEEDLYGDCEYDEEDYFYEERCEPPVEMPTREPRPYHIPEPENSFWDDDLQAWMVNRRPRVRFE